jgi:regulator of PEP synthase PpsR (kinase-PPPase family)
MQKEKDTIHQILVNNKYDPSTIEETKTKRKNHQKQDTEETKWAKFTYIGRETRFITKMFKKSNIRIALTTNNTIGKLLITKQEQAKSKYDKSGIYQLKCPTCNMKNIGQTDKTGTSQK